jgi:hypothetical protein
MKTFQDLAQAGYAAYCKRAGGMTFDGKELPTFEELGAERQACWIACAVEVLVQGAAPVFNAMMCELQSDVAPIDNHSVQAQPVPGGCAIVYSFKQLPEPTSIGFDEPGERA